MKARDKVVWRMALSSLYSVTLSDHFAQRGISLNSGRQNIRRGRHLLPAYWERGTKARQRQAPRFTPLLLLTAFRSLYTIPRRHLRRIERPMRRI